MADILVYEINGLSRPEYLSRQISWKKGIEKSLTLDSQISTNDFQTII
jgi:hypothetical protein